MGKAKEASRHLLNKNCQSPLLTKWQDDVLRPASKRDERLADGQETYNKLGKLLIQLAIGKTPWASNRNTEAMSKHHLGMQNLFMPLIASTDEYARNVWQVAQAQQVYSQGLLGCIFPPGGKIAGAFILKRCQESNTGMHRRVNTYLIVILMSTSGTPVNKAIKKSCLKVLLQTMLKGADKTCSIAQRLEEAIEIYSYFLFQVCHAALAATAVASGVTEELASHSCPKQEEPLKITL